jgi:hypothetical protein
MHNRNTKVETIPLYSLTGDLLLQPTSQEIQKKIPNRLFRSGDAVVIAKKHERILVERAGLIEEENALAAYVDKKRDKRRIPAEVGIECVIRTHRNSNGIHFLVDGKAESAKGRLRGCFDTSDYEEARDYLFAFIEAAGKWIDPAWFHSLLHEPMRKNKKKTSMQGKVKVKDNATGRPAAAEHRRGPAWRGLCNALRDLCRQPGEETPACTITEKEIIVQFLEDYGEVRLFLEERGLLKVTPVSQEIIRMVRIRTGRCVFEYQQQLYLPYRLALEIIHELRVLQGTYEISGAANRSASSAACIE